MSLLSLPDPPPAPIRHSGHDFELLLDRWESLVKRRGWAQTVIAEELDYPVIAVEVGAGREEASSLYLSAGVHGDECAPVWGLLQWAEHWSEREGSDLSLTIFPCLNPVGLLENSRKTEAGIDLNRHFQDRELPLIRAWQDYLAGRRYRMGLNLHEDYDATGIYLYEVARQEPRGEAILAACEGIIPRETAETVDGSQFENGLLRHERDIGEVIRNDLAGGWPEALYLYLHHVMNSYTFETPSEWSLETRVAAHVRCLERAVEGI